MKYSEREMPEKKQGQDEATVPGRILVMDDEPIIQECLQELLESFGYRVTVVGEGVAAIQAYKEAFQAKDPFHVVIMDLIVPGGMGAEKVVDLLKEFDSDLKAVVTSGDPYHEAVVHYRQRGFCGVLHKPVHVETVLGLLEEVFGRKTHSL